MRGGSLRYAALAILLTLTVPALALAAQVSGTLVSRDGHPLAGRQLNFQAQVASDIFIVDTDSDGNFMASLPPGTYNLRTEHGAILRGNIAVGDAIVDLHNVSELPAADPWRLLEREKVAEAIIKSPAPSSANLETVDTTNYGGASQPVGEGAAEKTEYQAPEPLPGLVKPRGESSGAPIPRTP
jgi:hypothetical protein